MRILVTGASGFLGNAVTAALAARGHSVVALSRSTTSGVPDRADRHIQGDIRSKADMVNVTADVDAVCHLAALTRVRESIANPMDYWQTNVAGTLNILDALTQLARDGASPKLVLASTGAVYGTPEKQPIDESQPTAPTNPYAATKLAADQAASHIAATGTIGAITLRAFNIAGASFGHADPDLTRLIPKIIAVQAGRADELVINGNGAAVRDFVHVDDMADAFVCAIDVCQAGSWREYNIGSGLRTSIRDVITAAEEATGKPVRLRHAPPANEPQVLVADPTRAIDELGWHPNRSTLHRIITDAWNAVDKS